MSRIGNYIGNIMEKGVLLSRLKLAAMFSKEFDDGNSCAFASD